MIDEEIAFLRSAAAEPDDDTLRLVYADWLDERGEEKFSSQAAFVRLQVRRSRMDVFDPDRDSLLEEESTYLQMYKRDWNGRIHHALHRRGLCGLVDARGGAIRGWNYHRGMMTHVSVTADGLAGHPELIFSLGPVESLRLVGWPLSGWGKAASLLQQLLPRLKVLALTSHWRNGLADLPRLGPLALIPVLDLRSLNCGFLADQLLSLSRSGAISPVVLFQRSVLTQRPYGRAADSRETDHVIDPFQQWDGLRLWYSDLIGKVLSPVRYQGTTR